MVRRKIFSPKRIGSLPLSKATMDVVCEALRRVMQKGGTGGNLFENYPISIAGSPAQQKQMGWIMGGLLLTVLLRNRKSLLHVCLNMPDSVLILLRR